MVHGLVEEANLFVGTIDAASGTTDFGDTLRFAYEEFDDVPTHPFRKLDLSDEEAA
jgi:hypothetical protein